MTLSDKRPEFTPTISFGQVVQILVLVTGFAGSFFLMQARTEENARRLDVQKDVITRVDARVRTLEVSAARSDERFDNILSLLSRIDSRLERIEYDGEGRAPDK